MKQRNATRVVEVDALRGFALFGICIVNVPFLAGIDPLVRPTAPGDIIASGIVEMLFQGKFFVLFSFLFGWSFSIQLNSAARAKRDFQQEHLRRLGGLFAFGVAHAFLVFNGDILILYSILGLSLLPLRTVATDRLIQIALCLIVVSFISMACLGIIVSELLPEYGVASGYTGSFTDSITQRSAEWPYAFVFVLMVNGPSALAAMCTGLAAANLKFFDSNSNAYLLLKRKWFPILLMGLSLNLLYALTLAGSLGDGLLALVGFAALAIGGPLLASLYLIAIVELMRRGRLGWLTYSGRMSLTAYIGEGIVAGLIFNGYGLKYYNQVGTLGCLAIAVGIFAVIHLFCVTWLRWKPQGPFEFVLRRITRDKVKNPKP